MWQLPALESSICFYKPSFLTPPPPFPAPVLLALLPVSSLPLCPLSVHHILGWGDVGVGAGVRGGSTGGAQGLSLALCSVVILGDAQGTMCSARNLKQGCKVNTVTPALFIPCSPMIYP